MELTTKETFKEGALMLKMGWAMSLSFILAYLSSYVLRGFIRHEGGTEMVGFYTAGYTILTTYVGMIFTAVGTDFYPRLAAVNKDQTKLIQYPSGKELDTYIIPDCVTSVGDSAFNNCGCGGFNYSPLFRVFCVWLYVNAL